MAARTPEVVCNFCAYGILFTLFMKSFDKPVRSVSKWAIVPCLGPAEDRRIYIFFNINISSFEKLNAIFGNLLNKIL